MIRLQRQESRRTGSSASSQIHTKSMGEIHLRLAGKAHVIELLRALDAAPSGLDYSQIHFNAVRTSATSLLLRGLVEARLVDHPVGNYRISAEGRAFLRSCESILQIAEPTLSDPLSKAQTALRRGGVGRPSVRRGSTPIGRST